MDFIDILLALIVIPVLGLVFWFAGSAIRAAIFKEGQQKGNFGSGLKSVIIGFIFFIVIGYAFKGCYRNHDNDSSIDYDGK